MREALERYALTVVHVLRDRIGKGDQRHWGLLDHGLRLLAHVLRQIIERADRLAGTARAFPAAEGLVARPGAGGRALRAVGVGNARLDVLMEPADFVRAAVEAGRKSQR